MNKTTTIITGNAAAGYNADGERVLRYFGGYLVETANGWDVHTAGGSILGPYKKQGEAKRMADAWGA